METYTLHQLHVHLQRIIALNFPEKLWIRCEIAQASTSRGHLYLDLVQKDDDSETVLAQARAHLWAKQSRKLQKKLGNQMQEILRDGVQVRLSVRVEFNPRYGMGLHIEDIDLHYTFGQLALQRLQTLKQLQQQKLIGKNSRHPLPSVIQRIAIISSSTAAGYEDFIQQVEQNAYGYHFDYQLFAAAMQGRAVEAEIVQQLQTIEKQLLPFDLVVIIRGGGAKLDLMAFDSYQICAAVASCSLPVLTGIGHEVDDPLIEQVAHTPLKTPTAVAEFILQHNLYFESQLLELSRSIAHLTQLKIQKAQRSLDAKAHDIRTLAFQQVQTQQQQLTFLQDQVQTAIHYRLQNAQSEVQQLADLLEAIDPNRLLKRGYSLVYQKGQMIRSVQMLDPNKSMITHFADGEIASKIIQP